MKTFRLYIGANNVTGSVELDKIEATLNQHFEGYTIEQATGYWLGKREDSAIVTISGQETKIIEAIKELKEVLGQEAIGYQVTTALNFI